MAEKMDAKLDYANQKVEQVIDTNRKLRVGIIGCGWIADAHIDSYKRMPDVELVAGCDLIPGKAAAFFKRNGVEGVKTDYASHKEMLDDESLQLDAVSICTYNRQHAAPAIYALSKGVNVLLSTEETYAEIAPVRLDRNGVSAFVAIMRGCDNFCSYCVVPYTRGRERSRDAETIVAEARSLFENGYREVTLLGQNVNSYKAGEVDFPELMRLVASISPLLRVRFATSHPKDMSDRLLEVMASMPNICRAIHLPAQSGATSMLERMNRKYTREWYLGRVAAIRRYLPDCAVTTDLIAGFSGETEQEHEATLSLMREVGYEFAYMFKYSERPGTFAHEHLPDDVPDEVKSRRLSEIIALQNELGHASNLRDVGREFEVLVEGRSKRDEKQLSGRTSQNKVVVFDRGRHDVGDYVRVRITGCTPATLFGEEII